MKSFDVLAAILLFIGGLNWGLVGFTSFDLVAAVFGNGSALARIVYAVVGLCAVYQAMQWKAIRARWSMAGA
jgi:uncharacterized membrane protein YuzA (DUF378 family)